MLIFLILAAVVGYLLGALPFGYLVARSKGINIFEAGSGNPGATNVRRVLGSGPGNLVFALDAAKGVLAAGWPRLLVAIDARGQYAEFGGVLVSVDPTMLCIVGLVAALVGHSFSCFTKFRGGKGVATSVGGLVVLMPMALLVGAAVWVATFYSTRYVSLASILGAVSLPIAGFAFHLPPLLLGLTGLIALFVILRHRSNIGRLLNGTESKFVKKSPSAPNP